MKWKFELDDANRNADEISKTKSMHTYIQDDTKKMIVVNK